MLNKDYTEKLFAHFNQLKIANPNEGRYKCWDCEKEIFDVLVDEENQKTLPMDMEGFRLLICRDCAEQEDTE